MLEDELEIGRTEGQPELSKRLITKDFKEVMEGSLRIAHLEEEYFSFYDEEKDLIDVEIEGWDCEVVIQDIIKSDTGKENIEEYRRKCKKELKEIREKEMIIIEEKLMNKEEERMSKEEKLIYEGNNKVPVVLEEKLLYCSEENWIIYKGQFCRKNDKC
jgi:hypothetical protein